MAKHQHRDKEKKSKKRKREDSVSDERQSRNRTRKHKSRDKDRERTRNAKHKHTDSSRLSRDDERRKRKKLAKHSTKGVGKHRKLKDERAESKAAKEVDVTISEKDYFHRATEFKVYLFTKKIYFETLSSEEAHELFEKFVKDWNRGRLDAHYYEGTFPEDLVTRARKTQHKWGFVKKLSDRDQMQLATANDSVHSSTENVRGVTSNVEAVSKGTAPRLQLPPPSRRDNGDVEDMEKAENDRRTEKKRQRKREKDKHAVVLDEVAPKETGRQAIFDKRREVGARTHAAAREREDAVDGLNVREADIMGGGDTFRETMARTLSSRQRKQSAKQEHLMGLAAKEEEKRAAFLEQMGLKGGQKITIQPRRDG